MEIYELGHMASHKCGASGYKAFRYKNQVIWEFKIAGKNRLYGVEVPATAEARKAGVAPLIVFDTLLREKPGGKN